LQIEIGFIITNPIGKLLCGIRIFTLLLETEVESSGRFQHLQLQRVVDDDRQLRFKEDGPLLIAQRRLDKEDQPVKDALVAGFIIWLQTRAATHNAKNKSADNSSINTNIMQRCNMSRAQS